MEGVNNKQDEHIKYSVSEGVIVMENNKAEKGMDWEMCACEGGQCGRLLL